MADWKALKWADGQPEDAPQVAILRQAFQAMSSLHSDANDMFVFGDLVDAATKPDGTAPLYGMLDLKADLDQYFPLMRKRLITGNHCRNGAGLGFHSGAWTNQKYRDTFGPEYHHTAQGNLNFLMLGDQGGSRGGEISIPVLQWARQVARDTRGENLIICLHQPLTTGYQFGTDASHFQHAIADTAIRQILDENDHIAGVFFGHMGVSIDQTAASRVVDGVTHVNFQMGIPTAVLLGWGEYIYSTFELNNGQSTGLIKRWGAVGGYLSGRDIKLQFKYPHALGDNSMTYDGRRNAPTRNQIIEHQLQVVRRVSDTRSATAPYGVVGEIQDLVVLTEVKDALDNVEPGRGVGIRVNMAGGIADVDAQSYQTNQAPGLGYGGGLEFVRTQIADTDYRTRVNIARGSATGTKVLGLGLCEDGSVAGENVADQIGDGLPVLGSIVTITSQSSMLFKGQLAQMVNLNSIHEPGLYRIESALDAATILNVPWTQSGGVLEVFATGPTRLGRNDPNWSMHRYTARMAGGFPRVWIRSNTSAIADAWTAWAEVISVVGRGGDATSGYVKYSNGDMKAWRTNLSAPTVSAASGASFISAPQTWTYGVTFVGLVSVRGETDGAGTWFSRATPSATSCVIYAMSSASKATATSIRVTVEGKWT